MVADAWDRVTSSTIANCFKHAGITNVAIDNNTSGDEQFDDDDNIPLADWVQIFNDNNILPENVTWDDYFSVDDAIETAEELSLEDIVNEALDKVCTVGNIDDIDDEEPEFAPPSFSETFNAIETLKKLNFFHGYSSRFKENISEKEREFEKAYVNNTFKKQTTIDEYFSKK